MFTAAYSPLLFMQRRLRRILHELAASRKRRPFLTQTVPRLPLPTGDHDHSYGHGVRPVDSTFEGSYVAVSGRPGERTVHVVNGRGGVNRAGTGIMLLLNYSFLLDVLHNTLF